jgi:cation:H+ antiporter
MLIDLIYILAGFVLLTWGADRFVNGASSIASLLRVPPILIGLTIVGFATSAPEILVSINAAARGLTSLAVGNAVGSNIANIGLVLGVTTLITPIKAHLSKALKIELPVLVLLTPATIVLFLDNSLDRYDALILIGVLILFLTWMVRTGLKLSSDKEFIQEPEDEVSMHLPAKPAIFWLVVGFGTLLGGAHLLVEGAESLAIAMGMSELVIGLTIVAIGTSLPELAVSVVAALRGDTSIAVGNVIGSNVFNLLAVVGVAGLVRPAELDPQLLMVHYPIMIVFTLALLRIAYNPLGSGGMGRFMGCCLLVAFMAYQTALFTGI